MEKNCMDPGSSARPVRPQAGWMPRGDVSHRTAAGIKAVRMVCDGSVSNESRLGSIFHRLRPPLQLVEYEKTPLADRCLEPYTSARRRRCFDE
jgi:hypothetical protein